MTATLDAQMEALEKDNQQRMKTIDVQEQEIDAILQRLDTVISDLETGSKALAATTVDGSIRNDARLLHDEMSGRQT